MFKALLTVERYKWTALEEYWHSGFEGGLPGMFVEFINPRGILVVSDPHIVQELYISKNKHFEKSTKMKRILSRFIGDSMLFDKSTQLWGEKRKVLSGALYKDRLNGMLEKVIGITEGAIGGWMGKREIDITQEIGTLVSEVVMQCLFGLPSDQMDKIPYSENGTLTHLNPGLFLQKNFVMHMKRQMNPLRHYFDAFDKVLFTGTERETMRNSETFRQFIHSMIGKGVQKGGDFLSTMLQDEMFRGRDEMVVDECLTFMLAATMTTTLLITNSIYYLNQNNETALAKLRGELLTIVNGESIPTKAQDWIQLLLKEELIHLSPYLTHCIQETLRLDPSLRFSTIHQIEGGIELGGIRILDKQPCIVNIAELHSRRDQWREPGVYRPERFDPAFPEWYLTPNGQKRHPCSFSPFLGGKRVCVGKTFAESIAKCILSMLFQSLEFEFVDESVKFDKPAGTFFHKQPDYKMRITPFKPK
ncbi:hypothetical protein FGO68_gene2481 [Halteria grandinella]|uniref:Cytochrome P450 n=1 Tax=Halteria grandinella TaxID=5974 RepID=A0A8J8NQN3_HALGN|nr:hypothetical protein FGO68_gene2481 [Halteria grandinella]